MKREIRLHDQHIVYTVRYSRRVRHIRMTIGFDDGLVISVPSRWHEPFIEGFIRQKAGWITKHLSKLKKLDDKTVIKVTRADFEKNKGDMLRHIAARVKFFNGFYKFSYGRISIRNQTSVWGSCTRQGNLQFNYKLKFLPQKSIDYVVVHELCHLKEHNHGQDFWRLVAKMIPDHKAIRKSLRDYIMKEE